jgi:hypothetical protein
MSIFLVEHFSALISTLIFVPNHRFAPISLLFFNQNSRSY